MGTTSEPASDQPDERGTLQRAVGGDQAAWAHVLSPYRKRLRRMVALRLDQRLRGRIDPSDVLQEAFLQAAQGLPKDLEGPEQPVFLWLRWLTGMTLQLLHRRHLGARLGTRAARSNFWTGPGPRRRRRPWRRYSWAATPAPAWPPSAPSDEGGCKAPSTPWTRWIARSWSSGISRS